MKIWSRFPVFRLLIPFCSGIICNIYYPDNLLLAVILALTGLFLALLFTLKNWATGKYAQRWLAGIPFYLCFWALGFLVTWFHQSINFSNHFKNNSSGKNYIFIAELYQPPVNYLKGYKLYTHVKAVKNSDAFIPVRGNLLIYVKDSLHHFKSALGDQILISCKPQLVGGATNPGAFNYGNYLHGKGIWHHAFTDLKSISILKQNSDFSMFATAIDLRDLLLGKLSRFLKPGDELGVAGALLLGYEDWLDPDLEKSYSVAGVLHVLCVSGMHVGLIYGILSWTLGFLENKKFLRNIRYLLLILLIWFYALLTGFTPSVIRAAAMITFVIAGKWMNTEANIYNLLCSSCLLLFVMDPFLIMSAGFQLSFLAVCGIVFIHKMILPLWEPSNNLVFRIWELISISIAAQITTFPLSLFLFHQFPNYFLLGNLMIIPLSTLVMYSGLIFLITDWIPYLGWLLGTATSLGIKTLNSMVVFLGDLPGSVTNNITISIYELIILYVLIVIILLWIIFKWRSLLFSWMLIVMLFLSFRIFQIYRAENQCVLTIYDGGKQALTSLIDSRNAFLTGDRMMNQQIIKRSAGEHLLSNLIRDTVYNELPDNCIRITKLKNGKDCILIRGWKWNTCLPADFVPAAPELLILSGELEIKAELILTKIKPKLIVFDSSCQRKQVAKLEKYFIKMGVATYDVSTNGAFLYQIK